jgi:drug/metabolite transporter (DMT)-like permease
MKLNIKYKAEAFFLLNTLIWGGTFVVVKNALSDFSPSLFVTYRFTIAALLIFPFVIKSLKNVSSVRWKEAVILGVLLYLGFAAQTIGLRYTTATKSAFFTGTFVVLTPLFQALIEKKIPKKEHIAGIVFVFIGIIFLSSKGTSYLDIFYELGENFNLGDFLTLVCAVFFALYIVYLDMISAKHDFKFLTFVQISVTALIGFIVMQLFHFSNVETIHYTFSGGVILALIYTALLATIVTTLLQTKYQQYVTPTKTGIIFSLEPIFAAVAAYFIIAETITYFGFIGSLFIFTGLLVSELWNREKN